MSRGSEAVVSWRRRTKERIVQSMGGTCYVCGYDRYIGAMDLHHIDPSTKLFSMGGMRANPKAWSRIVEELRKCILVCANCHREIEGGLVTLESPKSTFNEEFSDYVWKDGSRPGRTKKVRKCVSCDEELVADTVMQKYCSEVCRNLDVNQKKKPT